MDLIDMQFRPDGEYKWILHYQDHLAKFSCLRLLPAKKAIYVAQALIKIFLQQGTHLILQSDNGKDLKHQSLLK